MHDAVGASWTSALRNPGHHTIVVASVVFIPRYYRSLLRSGHFSLLHRMRSGMVLKSLLTRLLLGRIDVDPAIAGNKRFIIDEGLRPLGCLRRAASCRLSGSRAEPLVVGWRQTVAIAVCLAALSGLMLMAENAQR
jgi:hypothetical protein